jgi:hypothetical protein
MRRRHDYFVDEDRPRELRQIARTPNHSFAQRLSIVQKTAERPPQFRMRFKMARDLPSQPSRPNDEHIS